MLLGLAELSDGVTGLPVVAASLSLVGLVLIISWRLELGINRDIVVAVLRAAAQLLGVGVLFVAIFRSSAAVWFAAGWIVFMGAVATAVITRRAQYRIKGLASVAGIAVLGSAFMSIGVIFGFGVFEFDAVALVVIGGITIGNAVPAAVLGVNLSVTFTRDAIGTLEGLLALGFDRRGVVRFMTPRVAKTALIPQVERTKVVGLIALPGALAGLLLAGVDPLEAVVVQLLVMYLVLGTAAVSLISTVLVVMRSAVTDSLVPAGWTKSDAEPQS
ncbi:MAG: hypothetical protein HKN07_09690 [Acidimicrobiia bacterium]|nr:hypothetical protein [Acidimicrobiia bacterium]